MHDGKREQIETLDMGKMGGNVALRSDPICCIAHHLGETGSASTLSPRLPPNVHEGPTGEAAVVLLTELGSRARSPGWPQ